MAILFLALIFMIATTHARVLLVKPRWERIKNEEEDANKTFSKKISAQARAAIDATRNGDGVTDAFEDIYAIAKDHFGLAITRLRGSAASQYRNRIQTQNFLEVLNEKEKDGETEDGSTSSQTFQSTYITTTDGTPIFIDQANGINSENGVTTLSGCTSTSPWGGCDQ
eukprot:TRINITY_DN1958_c1_g2_i1.p2 TRINITY_DN1958_c1_g2~~TRINITY_DN1958_c1_g2_i1.p2  ORF type:complete len:168 (-),score=9.68 TRINITY_DN1958_c1_g2_i1:317-820(-)